MSDKTPSAPPPPQMSLPIANIHKSIYDAINLSKKQQWTITNYVVLVYGAIFGLSKYLGIQTTNEKAVLSLLALLAGAYAVVLLILIQGDLGRYREQLWNIYQYWLSDQEREQLKLKRYPNPAL